MNSLFTIFSKCMTSAKKSKVQKLVILPLAVEINLTMYIVVPYILQTFKSTYDLREWKYVLLLVVILTHFN